MRTPETDPESTDNASQDAVSPARKVLLGKITGVFGVKGWVKVHSDTEPRDNICSYSHWDIQPPGKGAEVGQTGDQWQQMELEDGREQGKTVVVKFRGIDDRDTAATLINSTVAVARSQLPPLAEGEFYWTDLIGFEVVDTTDVRLGTVSRLFATGANDVLVVQQDDVESGGHPGETEILIPWIRGSVIVAVDLDARTVRVDWDPDY